MQIEVKNAWTIHVKDFLSDQKFQSLFSTIQSLPFVHKDNKKSFKCDIALFMQSSQKDIWQDVFGGVGEDFLKIWKYLSSMYGKELIFNSTWGVMKMKKGFHIGSHFDLHSDIQWVMYFSDGWEESLSWGNLFLEYWGTEESFFVPSKNSLLLFPWKTRHRVSEYQLDIPRFSLSFWYSLQSHEERNAHYFSTYLYEDIEKF